MLIAETRIHLVACKARDYQQYILMMYQALAEFLTQQGLAVQNLQDRFSSSPENFEIHSEDLSDAGLEWVKQNLDRWMGNLDRRKKPMEYRDYLTSLAKTLK